jgi:hypothetical protein
MEIEFSHTDSTGLWVSVTLFNDDGWEQAGKGWMSKAKRGDETLAQFLSSFADLPGEEATALAAQIQGPWREEWWATGGKEDTRWLQR